ncbi:MAG: hypothetical protein EP216_03400 [Epsilonproteobacteria bacterium]|nr:MAG: hypothetical protein EP216_03400 [Campylobacterota bacterium]
MLRNTSLFITIIFTFFISILYAENIEADYSVEFGIVGEVGKVHATLKHDKKYYMIDANVSSLGIAKVVTNNLKERHISKGHIEKGLLVTDMYQMIKSYGEFTSTTIYQSDHRKKKLTRRYKKWKYDKLIIDRKMMLDYYGKDDMMTLFLNLSKHIKEKQKPKKYLFKAVGADRKNGRVDVNIPSQNTLKEIKKFVGEGEEGDWFTTVVMHRQLYQSKQGELDVRMGKEGLVEKAVLKDLIFFGDVRIIKQ